MAEWGIIFLEFHRTVNLLHVQAFMSEIAMMDNGNLNRRGFNLCFFE